MVKRGPCVKCGSKTTYIRPNGREEWGISEDGDICKTCMMREYRTRTYVPKPRTPLKGPCVKCGSKTTSVEKSGYAHWYQGIDGTICKRCFTNQRNRVLLPGQCIKCKIAYTKHGWHQTPKGTICNKCYKAEYSKILRGGLCSICGKTKATSWRNNKEHGRICESCAKKIYVKEIKIETISYYSNGKMACVQCGYKKNINALEIDHIKGGGNKDRKEKGDDGGWTFMRKLKKMGFPPEYQVLCANCNKIKQIEVDPK